ncbi:uncharacterized protein VICG_01807 [Vittaforma corneae ATCC 50505]|uniref:Ricin B lectin domain-containing protein n=1 Tax=Vittaforma corneae (strain ATCC 50505) TaxID=993615 RepID=L2GJZ9_VITCO|nr:uncharacterized protein VICG_01807 [Vittaforma corneae ATCC 50505]ELA41208.1 hypothetical protein VICG_01807 [Vittaforma corneae ATCC 50505]
MKLIILLITIAFSNKILDTIVGRQTRIRPTYYAYVVMSYNPSDDAFISSRNAKSRLTELKINRDGHRYIFGSGDSWLCVKHGDLKKCKDPTPFDIETTVIGFRIKSGTKCLTLGKTYRFEGCRKKNKKQDFVLEVDEKLVCNDMFVDILGEKYDLRKTIDMKAADQKKFDEAMKKLKGVSPKTKNSLRKIWKSRRYKWPKWGLC